MKELKEKKYILKLAICIIVLILAVLVVNNFLRLDLKYGETKKIELYIAKEFEIKDIKTITDEVLGKKKVLIQKVEVFEDTVSISAKSMDDEQKQSIIDKVNEKYEKEISAEDIEIVKVPSAKIAEIIKPYVVPTIIAVAIIAAYIGIKKYFKKKMVD